MIQNNYLRSLEKILYFTKLYQNLTIYVYNFRKMTLNFFYFAGKNFKKTPNEFQRVERNYSITKRNNNMEKKLVSNYNNILCY